MRKYGSIQWRHSRLLKKGMIFKDEVVEYTSDKLIKVAGPIPLNNAYISALGHVNPCVFIFRTD